MIKGKKDRMMRSEKVTTKEPVEQPEEATTDKPAQPKNLICTRECVVIGAGHYKAGDTISDPALIERLRQNPNFSDKEEMQ